MKCGAEGVNGMARRRSPCGERGLKSAGNRGNDAAGGSLPVRGAWVEMEVLCVQLPPDFVAPRAGSVG